MIIFPPLDLSINISLTPSFLSLLSSVLLRCFLLFMHFKREHRTLLRMSNPEFLTKDGKDSDFQILKRPTLEFQSENIETLSSSYSNSRYSQSIKGRDEEKEENRQICRVTAPRQDDSASSTTPSLEEKLKEEEDEENDGFKTPTSLDHKILVPSQCPPAPRKTKPSLKRKASCFDHCNCRHPLDLSKEVFELLFPTQHFSGSQQSTKKVRRQDHE
ncbi:uncharacterized protein LOC124827812 [Vigna umbellata]|uniref:uncharacterized protein LOC124827812 n=1 Tax=Vigna umbellata TaxID=87088 RepID=UPI001F5FC557|nr:uncharacterized protein LOC124827812 [Vigna umbellata]